MPNLGVEGHTYWEFAPIGSWPLGREEAQRFGSGLSNALRSAAGLHLNWSMVWETGECPRVLVGTSDPRGRNWIEGAVASAFGTGHWRSTQTRQIAWTAHRPRTGFPRTFEPQPATVTSSVAWAEPILLNLTSFPCGLRVIWEFLPTPPKQSPWWFHLVEGWNQHAPIPAVGPVARHARPAIERQASTPDSLRWLVRLRSEAASGRLVPQLSGLENLVSEAFRSVRGPLRFRTMARSKLGERGYWVASEHEVAGLWPRPGIHIGTEGPATRDEGSQWILGESTGGRVLRLAHSAGEGRHLTALGETGMGKSSVLLGLAREAARNSNVILMDPIGDTARRFLRELDPEARTRVRFVSPKDSPLGLNALQIPDAVERPDAFDRSLGELLSALRRIRATHYGEVPYWGPRIEETLHDVLELVARCSGGTLADAASVLRNGSLQCGPVPEDHAGAWKAFRRRVLDQPDDVEGARRLLSEATRSAVLRRMLSARRPDWSLTDIETAGRITIFSGDAPYVGEVTARYLLTFYCALIWAQLLGRSPARKLCWVLDEIQWYAPESLADAFEVSRRLNVHLWAATQSLTSLPAGLREAMDTNVADWIVFRCGGEDARRLARGDLQLLRELSVADDRGWAVWLPRKSHRVERMKVLSNPSPLTPPGAEVDRLFSPTPEPANGGRAADGLASLPACSKVYLSDLGLGDDPASGEVRAKGGRWGRRGWILKSGRDARGAFWLVRPEALSEWGAARSPMTVTPASTRVEYPPATRDDVRA